MKKLLFFFCFCPFCTELLGQNVGIGTSSPKARLHVSDSNVLFSATGAAVITPADPPISGQGRRMMWYADKAAFRAGYVTSSNWDKNNVGEYSIALGNNPKATGNGAVAIGNGATATAINSFAIGSGAFASAPGAVALGLATSSQGGASTSMGVASYAREYAATAMGYMTNADGAYSTSIGHLSYASAEHTIAAGESVVANAWASVSMGRHNDPVVAVSNVWTPTDPLFLLGNGTGTGDKRNALTVLKNGKIGLGNNNTPLNPLSFPATIEKKISLFPGATGDVGFAVGPSLLKIYGDHPDADIAFGYDNYGDGFTERMRVKGNGNMGIGINDPSNPLSFAATFGKKISLYHAVSGDIGLGVDGNLMKIYADNENADIALGFDNYTTGFTETMRVKGNGRVGIGTTSPTAPLGFPASTGKKITLYPGSTGDVGFAVQGNLLQIYSDHSDADIAFGYDQAGTFTERFRMRGTGALAVNGNTGSPGQFLMSNGSTGPPMWKSPVNQYTNTVILSSPLAYQCTNLDPGILIPNLSYTFSCPDSCKILVTLNYRVFVENTNCAGGISQPHIELFLDNTEIIEFFYDVHRVAVNQSFMGSHMVAVGPGTHTIEARAFRYGCSIQFTGGGFGTNMIVQLIPK